MNHLRFTALLLFLVLLKPYTAFSAESDYSLQNPSFAYKERISVSLPAQGYFQTVPYEDEKPIFAESPEQELNPAIEKFINYFTGRGKEYFMGSIERSEQYLPIAKEVFAKTGLPEEIAYLPIIESGFKINAVSRAKATGPWQFMAHTAKRYGLRIDTWVDERKDFEKATIAAANYLSDLYAMFNDWHLALAAYNAGEAKIMKALARTGSSDFWELRESKFLKNETREYVPKFIAAKILATKPEEFGLEFSSGAEFMDAEEVEVKGAVSLSSIARAVFVDEDEIKRLNPSLLKDITPPNEVFNVKIPLGTKELFEQNKDKIEIVPASYIKKLKSKSLRFEAKKIKLKTSQKSKIASKSKKAKKFAEKYGDSRENKG